VGNATVEFKKGSNLKRLHEQALRRNSENSLFCPVAQAGKWALCRQHREFPWFFAQSPESGGREAAPGWGQSVIIAAPPGFFLGYLEFIRYSEATVQVQSAGHPPRRFTQAGTWTQQEGLHAWHTAPHGGFF
jgi:hypothetical protein